MRQTPLHDTHVGLDALMVDFAGWHMPVRYAGIIPEVETTRKRVGLFDIGHMGRLELVGPQHLELADRVMSCAVAKLAVGRIKYGLLLKDDGYPLDDVLVYRDVDRTHLVINAGNRERDVDHVREQCAAGGFDARVLDAADPDEPGLRDTFLGVCQQMIALQGPRSEALLSRVIGAETDLSKLGYYRMTRSSVIAVPCLVSRTGYTGEDGFELFFDARQSVRIWDVLMAQGEDLGAGPVGLGARDTLRLEAGMPLYGHEIDLETTPLEARLDFGVNLEKEGTLGIAALRRQKAAGFEKLLVGFEVDTKRVPREGCALLKDGRVVGKVASGTWSPTLEKNIGTGFVPPSLTEIGSTFDVDIRGKTHTCTVVPMPFYKRPR